MVSTAGIAATSYFKNLPFTCVNNSIWFSLLNGPFVVEFIDLADVEKVMGDPGCKQVACGHAEAQRMLALQIPVWIF